jgi:hypothetical protein
MERYINLIYDFNRRPYDVDWWSTQSGAPTVVSGNLEIGGSSTVMSADFMKGNLEMELTIPTAPAAGHTRQFGWKSVVQGAYAYFEVTGATFQAATSDGEGNTQTSEITWNSDWDNTATLFQIRWDASGFTFLVNGIRKAKISELNKMPRVTLSPYMNSTGAADTVLVKYVSIIGAQTIFHIESINSDYVASDPGHIASLSDTMTITEAITVTPLVLVGNTITEPVTVTESITMDNAIVGNSISDTMTMTEAVTVSSPA